MYQVFRLMILFFIFIQFASCKSRREVLSEGKIFSSETLERESADAEILRYLKTYGVPQDEWGLFLEPPNPDYSGVYTKDEDEGFALRGGEQARGKNAERQVINEIKHKFSDVFVVACAQGAVQIIVWNFAEGICIGVAGPIRGRWFNVTLSGEEGSFSAGLEASVSTTIVAFDVIPAGFTVNCQPSMHNKIGKKLTSAAAQIAQKALPGLGKHLQTIRKVNKAIRIANGVAVPVTFSPEIFQSHCSHGKYAVAFGGMVAVGYNFGLANSALKIKCWDQR